MLELCLSYCSDFLLFFYESNLKEKNSVATHKRANIRHDKCSSIYG